MICALKDSSSNKLRLPFCRLVTMLHQPKTLKRSQFLIVFNDSGSYGWVAHFSISPNYFFWPYIIPMIFPCGCFLALLPLSSFRLHVLFCFFFLHHSVILDSKNKYDRNKIKFMSSNLSRCRTVFLTVLPNSAY